MRKRKNRQKRKKKRSNTKVHSFCRLRAWEEEYGEKWKQQDIHSFGVDKRAIYVVM